MQLLRLSFLFVLCAAGGMSPPAFAQALLLRVAGAEVTAADLPPRALRGRPALAAPDVLATEPAAVSVELLTGETVVFERVRAVGGDRAQWYGRPRGADGEATFATQDGRLAASFRVGARAYGVQRRGASYLLFEVSTAAADEAGDAVPAVGKAAGEQGPLESARAARSNLLTAANSEATVDLLVIYTSAAATALAGAGASAADVALAVDLAVQQTNVALANTAVDHRVQVVQVVATAYDESASSNLLTHLNQVRFVGGIMAQLDDVHVLREDYLADAVILLVEPPSPSPACGLSTIPFDGPVGDPGDAFAVVVASCATSAAQYSFAHETGHLLGLWHHSDLPAGPYAYGRGFTSDPTCSTGAFRTLMGQGALMRVLYWSNDDFLLDRTKPNRHPPQDPLSGIGAPGATGCAMGDATHDARAALALTMPAVAGFREAALPVELVHFEAFAEGADVQLAWVTASEQGNAGFGVEVRAAEAPWRTLAFVDGAGTSATARHYAYRAVGLGPGRYTFRLKQVDQDGAVAYSTLVEVTLLEPSAGVLSIPYPNPFDAAHPAAFTLRVPRTQRVRVEAFDVAGRRVGVLFDGVVEAGVAPEVRFSGRDLPIGVYVVQAVGETFREVRPVLFAG